MVVFFEFGINNRQLAVHTFHSAEGRCSPTTPLPLTSRFPFYSIESLWISLYQSQCTSQRRRSTQAPTRQRFFSTNPPPIFRANPKKKSQQKKRKRKHQQSSPRRRC